MADFSASYRDKIAQNAHQIFQALNIEQLVWKVGRESALDLKETFLKIYRDQAQTAEEQLLRQRQLDKWRAVWRGTKFHKTEEE